MTSPIEKPQTAGALAHARATAAAEAAFNGDCQLLEPAGLQCEFVAGHPGRCVPASNHDDSVTEPPAADPSAGSAPAASVAPEPEPEPAGPRQYGFKRRKECDVETPGGDFIRVRTLSTSQVMKLGVLNMKDAFGADLLRIFQSLDGSDEESIEAAAAEAEQWATDPERSGKVIETLDKILEAAVVCPKVVLVGETNDEQINVNDIELTDKWAVFDAAMPEELKSAAQGAQLAALKSVRR